MTALPDELLAELGAIFLRRNAGAYYRTALCCHRMARVFTDDQILADRARRCWGCLKYCRGLRCLSCPAQFCGSCSEWEWCCDLTQSFCNWYDKLANIDCVYNINEETICSRCYENCVGNG